MPRQVQILLTCDPCERWNEEQVEGEPFVVAIGHMKPREIIVCEVHKKELLTPLHELLPDLPTVEALQGNAPLAKGPKDTSEPEDCLVAGCGQTLKNRSTLQGHIRNKHDMKWSQYRTELLGESGPTPRRRSNEDDPQLDLDDPDFVVPDQFKCTEPDVQDPTKPCGAVYDPREYSLPAQAIGLHRAKVHGIKGPKSKRT